MDNTDARWRGVSVFPDGDGLYRYMVGRRADFEGCLVVELEGDADEGALLVIPTRIVDTRPVDGNRLARAKAG